MHITKRFLSKIRCESFLIGILHLIGLISLYNDDVITRRGRPYVYPTTVMLRCFVVRIWMRIPNNNALHYYFSINTKYNQRIMKACGLHNLPDRRTFDRRFKTIPVKDMINTMGRRFVSEGFADSTVVAVDSSLIHAKNRHVWHKSAMKNNMVPRSGIDTEARWGFSRNKGWVFGYKLHLSCSSTGKLIVPLSVDFSTANVSDNQMYCSLVEPLPNNTVRYVVADLGYDNHKLYDYSKNRGITLVCPIRRYRHTKGKRLKHIQFYKSDSGQQIYKNRSISVEPLFWCIKDTFGISVMPVSRFANARSYVMLCVLVYQLVVYYNCITGMNNPRHIKGMLGN